MRKVILVISLLTSALFASIGLSEFYIVAIKNETEFYPFGGEGPVPYFYRSAELYSNVCLSFGILFSTLVVFGIWNWRNKRISDWIVIGFIGLMFAMWFINGEF